jgi:hypothetical protein
MIHNHTNDAEDIASEVAARLSVALHLVDHLTQMAIVEQLRELKEGYTLRIIEEIVEGRPRHVQCGAAADRSGAGPGREESAGGVMALTIIHMTKVRRAQPPVHPTVAKLLAALADKDIIMTRRRNASAPSICFWIDCSPAM